MWNPLGKQSKREYFLDTASLEQLRKALNEVDADIARLRTRKRELAAAIDDRLLTERALHDPGQILRLGEGHEHSPR